MARRNGRKKRRRQEPDVPVQSFADIAFLLIIYFILAASLSQDWGFRTDLPAGEKATEATSDKSVLLREDALLWGEKTVSIDELRSELTGLGLAQRDAARRVVQFEARGNVPWQDYYAVLAAIEAAGGVPGIVMDSGDDE